MSGINDKEFANIDGDIVNYEIEYSQGRVNPNTKEGFMSSADGGDDYYDADGDDDYYNAGGIMGGFRKAQAKREKRRALREKSKADARVEKAKAKQTMANAQVESAKAMAKGTEGDIALAKSLEAKADSEPVKEGMSAGVKIGIGVALVLVLGVVGFIVYKKMGKKGKGK